MKEYNDIFFDLDKTLWDFTSNTADTFSDLFYNFNLYNKGISSCEDFYSVYEEINTSLWEQYRQGRISKEYLSVARFQKSLLSFGVDDEELAALLSREYIRISPLKTKLIKHATETLDYLSPKYNLHIITNGFSEVQFVKIRHSGLEKYFKNIITSEEVGLKKPHPAVFEFSLVKAKAQAEKSLMIGDDMEVDIIGAQNAGIDQVYYNPEDIMTEFTPTFKIRSLRELVNIL